MIIIWGKPQCPHCDQAKAFCERNNLAYEYKQLDVDFTGDDFIFIQSTEFANNRQQTRTHPASGSRYLGGGGGGGRVWTAAGNGGPGPARQPRGQGGKPLHKIKLSGTQQFILASMGQRGLGDSSAHHLIFGTEDLRDGRHFLSSCLSPKSKYNNSVLGSKMRGGEKCRVKRERRHGKEH